MTQEPTPYPRQELLPQQVEPSRSRLPLLLVGVVVVVALVVGGVIWWSLKDDGEEHRAAYCSALRTLTEGRGLDALAGATGDGGTGVPKVVDRIRELAPEAVRSQWDDLVDLLQSIRTTEPGIAEAARAFGDIRVITDDANTACGLNIQIPG